MIASIAFDDALILSHRANPTGSNCRERHGQYCTDNIRPTDAECALMLGIQAVRRMLGVIHMCKMIARGCHENVASSNTADDDRCVAGSCTNECAGGS